MDVAAVVVGVIGETSMSMDDNVPTLVEFFSVSMDFEGVIDVFTGDFGTEVLAVAFVATLEAGFSLRT